MNYHLIMIFKLKINQRDVASLPRANGGWADGLQDGLQVQDSALFSVSQIILASGFELLTSGFNLSTSRCLNIPAYRQAGPSFHFG